MNNFEYNIKSKQLKNYFNRYNIKNYKWIILDGLLGCLVSLGSPNHKPNYKKKKID